MAAVLVVASAAGCTAHRPAAVPAGLAKQAADAAENDPHFLRQVATTADRIGCVADVFGAEPEQKPKTVYANLSCAEIPADGDLVHAPTLVTPAAITLGADPAVVMPAEDGDWTAAVHRVIPRQWWNRAENGSADPEAQKKRLDDRVAALGSTRPRSPSASPS